MARSRLKSQGRRGGEGEQFAYLPQSVLQSEAAKTMPHACLRILAILLVGKAKDRNGTMMCSESYAARYGVTSRATVRRSLEELEARGLIERTRRVQPFRKAATLWAVCWWPVHYREGQPLDTPEPASHRYRDWKPSTPIAGVNTGKGTENPSHPWRDSLTPTAGVKGANHHTHGDTATPIHHTYGGGHSKNLGRGRGLAQQLADVRLADLLATAREHPDLDAVALAQKCRGATEADAHRALQALQAGSAS